MCTSEWTKEQEIALINKTQDEYIDELVRKIKPKNETYNMMKEFNFTSPTGTGKTNMMAKLINRFPDIFFIITSPSKGSLSKLIATSLSKLCKYDNYIVYGTMSYTKVSILQDDDILGLLPDNKPVIWLRDEGHITTTRWTPLLEERCQKIINFSATNKEDAGVVCNFTHTMMLRTVHQQEGSIEDAIARLKNVKKLHKDVSGYNPCAIFRVVNNSTVKLIENICKKKRLKAISIVDNDDFKMEELCDDNNKYDVIINKQKIVEGIDIRRAHVVWLENQPNNIATIIQFIGRCRRNALLWRDDINILDKSNEKLLDDTRKCYVYYNKSVRVDQDETGELTMAFCPYISVQKLKVGHTIYVNRGQMKNGLYVIELEGKTGYFEIKKDEYTGFNIVENKEFYKTLYQTTKNVVLHKQIDFYKNLLESIRLHFNNNMLLSDIYTLNKDGLITHTQVSPITDKNGNLIKHIETVDKDYFVNNHKENVLKMILSEECVHQYKKVDFIDIGDDCFIDISNMSNHCSETWLRHKTKAKKEFKEIYNDRLLSIIGVDEYRALKVKDNVIWIPENGLYKKLSRDTKLNAYISTVFEKQIIDASMHCFSGKNNFNFDKKRNSCLGYCVEYYAKYLLFGIDYLNPYISNKDLLSCLTTEQKTAKIVRACMDKYKQLMKDTYGENVTGLITTISEQKLLEKENEEFSQTVVQLGIRAYNFIKDKINVNEAFNISPMLNTKHIKGLVDVMSKDTIIDIKCTNHIDTVMIKQVFAYYLLSLYKHDVDIKRLIIYDAVSDKSIEIDVENLMPKQKIIEHSIVQQDYLPLTICFNSEKINQTIDKESEPYLKQEKLCNFLYYCKKVHNTNIVSNGSSVDIQNISVYDWIKLLNQNNSPGVDKIRVLARKMYCESMSNKVSTNIYDINRHIELFQKYIYLLFPNICSCDEKTENQQISNIISSNQEICGNYLWKIFGDPNYYYSHPNDKDICDLQTMLSEYSFSVPKTKTISPYISYTKPYQTVFGNTIFEIVLTSGVDGIYRVYATTEQKEILDTKNHFFIEMVVETVDGCPYAILREINDKYTDFNFDWLE
jgi:hypothetical protein